MEKKETGGILLGLSGIALLLGMQPSYLPVTYPESVQGIFSIAAVLFGLIALYLVATSELG